MYTIRPSKRKITFKENELIPDHMPQLPLRALFVGSSASGKTQALASMLREDDFGYKAAFKGNIFLFSSTASLSDPAWDGVNIKEENIWNTYREDIIKEIIDDQEQIIKTKSKEKCPHSLIILDDLICDIPTSRQSSLINLYLSGRHRCLSIIILSQVFRGCVPKGVRLNCTSMMIWKVNNMEATSIAEEQVINKDDFIDLLETATEEDFSFLYINNQKKVNERYYLRFEQLLQIES